MAEPPSELKRHFFGEATMELLEAIGDDERAMAFFKTFGGGEGECVPHNPRPDHKWAEVLGQAAFARLCERFGGCRIYIPNLGRFNPRRRGIEQALLENTGESRRSIAFRFGVTERLVRQIAKEMRDAGLPVPCLLKKKRKPGAKLRKKRKPRAIPSRRAAEKVIDRTER